MRLDDALYIRWTNRIASFQIKTSCYAIRFVGMHIRARECVSVHSKWFGESIVFHYGEWYTIAANMNSDIIHHSFSFVMYSAVFWIVCVYFLFGMSSFFHWLHSLSQSYSSLLYSLGLNSMVFTTEKMELKCTSTWVPWITKGREWNRLSFNKWVYLFLLMLDWA